MEEEEEGRRAERERDVMSARTNGEPGVAGEWGGDKPGVAGERGGRGGQDTGGGGRLRPDLAGKRNERASPKRGSWFPDTGPALFVSNAHF